jgi:hypothetical protein
VLQLSRRTLALVGQALPRVRERFPRVRERLAFVGMPLTLVGVAAAAPQVVPACVLPFVIFRLRHIAPGKTCAGCRADV